MKTYVNGTDKTVTVNVPLGDRIKTHTIAPGQKFSFCDRQNNSAEIEQQLLAAGAHYQQEAQANG